MKNPVNMLQSVGYISPSGISSKKPNSQAGMDKYNLYRDEKKIVKEAFKNLGKNIDWTDDAVQKQIKIFARKVIETTQTELEAQNLLEQFLPVEELEPGETFVLREVHGINIWEGSYGASVRMSRPQFTEFTVSTNLKEVGIHIDLTQVRTGKYSPSELANYASNLITVWRNRLLFVTTLAGMTQFQSSGSQFQSGAGVGFGTMDAAINLITDEQDVQVIVGRRNAVHKLSNMSGWSDTAKDQFQRDGQVGWYAGIPVIKVNSFTDPDYGIVYPMPDDELWLFSSLPAGRIAIADRLRTGQETILSNEALNIYMRFDDGIGIFRPNRIARLAELT